MEIEHEKSICCLPASAFVFVLPAGFRRCGGPDRQKNYELISPESYEGYWEEKKEGRLLMTVTPTEEPGWYDVTVTLREKHPKTDVYMMRAHYQEDGSMYYENCLFVLRKVKSDGSATDKVKYRNGSGLLYYSFDENVLYWTDYTLKPEKRVLTFIKTASPDADEAK